ncbi:hypothetical protein [Roseomonas haemaphysalidis]|uniref:Flagellar protein FlgN n=1 Tax=Roseomonas haemaphysalidis TaxID=2768162 RepID=A0ABS3KLY7_9PROT|nr:hypothetical protein [Roseomonas haemaphysalidis]MBO1078490.1 hypothetical protein [Roseomonas haemaphysalidis]
MSNPRTSPSESSAGYAANRFTGYGGSDEATWKQMELEARAQDAQQALSPALNPVISRLREDLDRLLEEVPLQPAPPASEATQAGIAQNLEHWSLAWRQRALADLDERVAEMRQVYVINRGDAHRHLLFLDRQGRHMLAVQPQEPTSALRYNKLAQGTELNDLYGPFARLSDTPRG